MPGNNGRFRFVRVLAPLIFATAILLRTGVGVALGDRQRSPVVIANPDTTTGAGSGKTTITWATGDDSPAEVWVSIDGGREILFAGQSASGSQEANWIDAGSTYDFRLYAGINHEKLLAHVVVTRRQPEPSAGTPTPPPPEPGPQPGVTLVLIVSLALLGSLAVFLAVRRARKRPTHVSGTKANLIECSLVLALAGVVYTNGLETMYVHADESAWISSSNIFDEYFQGHFSSPVWSEDYNAAIGTSVLFNSTVTRFIIGIGRRIGGIGPGGLNPPYDFSLTREQNIEKGRMPSPDLLWWSRIVISVLSALGIAIGFHLIKDATGAIGGYVWLALSLTSTYFLFTIRTAMDEGPLVLGCVLVTWSISRFLRVSSGGSLGASVNKDYFLWLVIMGIFVGYSAGVKLNGAILIVPCLAAVLLAVYQTPPALKKRLEMGLVGASVIIVSAYLAFLAPNPYLWRNPIAGPAKMFEQRVHTIATQYDENPDLRIPSGVAHLQFFVKRVYSTFSPLNVNAFEGWYATPRPPKAIEPILILNFALTAIGFIYCCRQAMRYVATRESLGASATAVLLVGLCASGPVLAVNLDQARYYVIPIYFSTMLLSMAIDRIATATHATDMSLPARSSHQ